MSSELPPQPVALADLIDWQEGTVVSRTVVKNPSGTVTVFAFDAGEGLSEHTAPYDALVLAIEGRAEVTIAQTRHELTPGQVVRLPAGIPHAVHAKEPLKMLLVMIRSEPATR